ncbi:hypothetical protein FEZ48_10870 [Marinilactibacillus psychrotolerans]|uniref:Uncharacterized protein n=1 Tax=Marinilactibacillus psychrotolerans TaxID=191770 RepID=A0A5R9C0D0_9LACT|nr:hypothetical protein [Marinilactibacillus psychrotolerans]TLQ06133.1 hypothetical protein FEZ48_10870 [Marinilactibacillus psychrotolerans]
MRTISEDYHSNLQTVLNSSLSLSKKISVLNGIAEQLEILCDKKQITNLTENDRITLQIVHRETKKAVYHLSKNV